jgi:hypothetical protein
VVVLPWNEFYTEAHVAFIGAAVKQAVAQCTGKGNGTYA